MQKLQEIFTTTTASSVESVCNQANVLIAGPPNSHIAKANGYCSITDGAQLDHDCGERVLEEVDLVLCVKHVLTRCPDKNVRTYDAVEMIYEYNHWGTCAKRECAGFGDVLEDWETKLFNKLADVQPAVPMASGRPLRLDLEDRNIVVVAFNVWTTGSTGGEFLDSIRVPP